MLDALYHWPPVLSGVLIIGVTCALALSGLVWARRVLLPRLRVTPEDSEFTGAMVQAVMVFYGLAVALIAVNVWETHSNAADIVSREAIEFGALYHDVSGYPMPVRGQLQAELRDYLEYVIDEAWPGQRRGETPRRGAEFVGRFQATLVGFEPASDGQRILHAEALRAYNQAIEARRLRLDAVQTRLHPMLWVVVVVGGFISLASTFFFRVADCRLHALMVGLLAAFVGLIVFMILVLDRPFQGVLAVDSEPYRLVVEQLMRR